MVVTDGKLPEDKLFVAIHHQAALIRVEGRGSFKVSSSLKDFGLAAIEEGCRTAVFDMKSCISMDSTFMGVLAGLANRLRQAHPEGRVVLLNMAPRTRSLVATLGLDQIVASYQLGETPKEFEQATEWMRALEFLEQPAIGKKTTTEVMLEAHENLVRLSPENAPRFQDVLTFLREKIKKTSSST